MENEVETVHSRQRRGKQDVGSVDYRYNNFRKRKPHPKEGNINGFETVRQKEGT